MSYLNLPQNKRDIIEKWLADNLYVPSDVIMSGDGFEYVLTSPDETGHRDKIFLDDVLEGKYDDDMYIKPYSPQDELDKAVKEEKLLRNIK